MNLRATVLTTVWVLIATAAVYASPVGDCPAVDPVDHTDHLPDDKNCSLFYKCDHAAPVLFVCPDGLHFNRVLEVCDWPDAAGCSGGSGECPAIGTCPQNEDENSIAVHLPHASDCTKFCKCDHGNPVTFDCPAGLHFNPTLEVCDWPENAGCSGGSSSAAPSPSTSSPTSAPSSTAKPTSAPSGNCPAVGTCPQNEDENSIAVHLPHATNCSQFCKCDHGNPVTFDCPAGLHFNPTLEVCDWPENAGCSGGSSSAAPSSTAKPTSAPSGDCPAVGSCPQNEDENSIAVHLPHASDCTKFCKCDHGNPVTFDCPAGLNFNPTLQVCDWPENAGCSGGSSSATPSPSTVSPTSASSSTTTPTSAPSGNCPAVGTCPQNEDENSIAVHLPHASDCTKFCKCDHGNSVTFDCPAGLYFNPILEVCDWPENAGCVGVSTTCDAVGSCPQYDQDSIVVHLPHRTNCGLYCRCNHGVPITEKCPDGLHFNADLEVCDWPAAAGCE